MPSSFAGVGMETPDIFHTVLVSSAFPNGPHPLWLGKKGVERKNICLVAKLSRRPQGFSELPATAGACPRPAGLVASSLGRLSPLIPCSASSNSILEGIAPTQPRPAHCSLWEVQVSARQVGSSPRSLKQQLSSQSCPAAGTWAPRCHLPILFPGGRWAASGQGLGEGREIPGGEGMVLQSRGASSAWHLVVPAFL